MKLHFIFHFIQTAKQEEELNSDDWFGGMDEEYEEADWETEAMFKTLEEARECEKELIEEI